MWNKLILIVDYKDKDKLLKISGARLTTNCII